MPALSRGRRARRIGAIALALSLLAIAAPTASAETHSIITYWRTGQSNTTRTYNYSYAAGRFPCPPSSAGFKLRMDVALGTVTATTVRVKSVKFTWSNFLGSPAGIYNDQTEVNDSFGHDYRAPHDVNWLKPTNGTTFTWSINKTFTFNQSNQVVFEHYDQWPHPTESACSYRTVLQAVFRPGNPS